jgi:excisionase family DNA binding protein
LIQSSPLQTEKTLNTQEAADYLRISVANLRVKVSRGEVPINGKLGRTLRFKREELDKLLESSINGDSNDY